MTTDLSGASGAGGAGPAAGGYGSGAVVTPEAVQLDFQAAGVGSRGVALFLDLLVLVTVAIGVSIGASLIVATEGLGLSDTAAIVVVLILNFLVFFGYPVALETLWRGRTLGKAAMGLRVVTVDGAPVRFRHAAIRAALQLIDLGFFGGLPAVISMLVTRRHQRLGDLVAGTMVLRERLASGVLHPARFGVPYGLGTYAETVDAAGLTEQEYSILRSFLLRAGELEPAVREQLARRLADRLAAKLGAEPPAQITTEQFLVTLAARYQQRGEAGLVRSGVPAPQPPYPPPAAPYGAPSQAPPATDPAPPQPPPTLGDFVPPS